MKTYDEFMAEVEEAIEDATSDYPDVNPDDIAHDMAASLLAYDPPTSPEDVKRAKVWFGIS